MAKKNAPENTPPLTEVSDELYTLEELTAKVGSAVNAALGGRTHADQRPRNRFDEMFPLDRLVFRNNIKPNADRAWKDGTTAHQLADVLVGCMDIDGAYISCTLKHLKHQNGAEEFRILFPSSGGEAFRKTMIDTRENPEAAEDLRDWNRRAVLKWIEWRTAQVKAGAGSIHSLSGVVGVQADATTLAALGIGAPMPPIQRSTDTPGTPIPPPQE